MTVVLRAHRTCTKRRQLQRMLHLLNVPYNIELDEKGEVCPPALFVNGRLVTRGLPTMAQLMTFFAPTQTFQRAF